MPGVFERLQIVARSVALRSQVGAAVLSLAALCSLARPAYAEGASSGSSPPAIRPASKPERTSYGTLLAASYVAAPPLAIAAGAGLFELTGDDTLSVLGGGLMFLLPASVHIAHGNGRGVASAFEMIAVTAAGVLVGGATGFIIDRETCSNPDGEECDLAGLNGIIYGGLLGGLLGYVGYAIYDVSENASVVTEKGASGGSSWHVWVTPLASRRREMSGTNGAWNGVELRAALQF